MDFYKTLPTPARYGIPVALAVLVLGLVFFMMTREPKPVIVVTTQDTGVYEAAQKVLDAADIPYKKESDAAKSIQTLSVLPDLRTDASDALANSGIKDRSGTIKPIECPAPPGFTATKAANERANNCEDAKSVQSMLITAGASAANVKVSQMANETLLGPESSKSVLGQVFLPPGMIGKWPADQAARAIATAVGTSIDNVTITDDKLQTLFDGSRNGASAAAGMGGVGTGTGCADMATATEIATKEAAVRSCYKDTIGADLVKLLGGSDRFVLTVQARIDAKSRTSQYQRNARGAVNSRMLDKGSGRVLDDVDMEPNTQTGGEVKPAGDLKLLALNVTLDSNVVDERQELAVKRLLSTYVDPSRKDPAPKVTRIAFSPGAGKAPDTSELEQLQTKSTAGTGVVEGATREKEVARTPQSTKALLVIGAILIAAMAVMLALLWRRSTLAAAERARYEQEFQNQQRVLDTYAQQDPASVAQDLERLFGAPAAPERTFS